MRTFGEFFPDGSILDLVARANDDQPVLLLWDGAKRSISPEIDYRGHLFQAEQLDSSILRATRFPREPADYGTIRQLFTELAATFGKYLAFSKSEADRVSFWVLTTWFSDCLASPPTLWISGVDLGRAAIFFALLHTVCRRALRVAGINRNGFLSLPMTFRPTLLVNQPDLPPAIRTLWRESNFRGSVVPLGRGAVVDVSSAKAIFAGMGGATPSPSAGDLHLALFPANRKVPPLDEAALDAIANHFLPRLLQYRLEHAKRVRESRFEVSDIGIPVRELAHKLGACVQGDTELALRVVQLLLPQDDVVGQCNVDVALIQVLWPRLHSCPANNNPTRLKIEAELTAEVNTFLLSCGETLQYSREEMGIRVAALEFARKRTKTGSILLLSSVTNRRVHELARSYGIGESVPGCMLCHPKEKPAE